ncbi:MAG TPA: phosphocholine cytidylyltransferase family protein [Kofleriaceae bacterium]|jgi:choline kinase|nr:phosphocholine cytidylyltransferase family protein [Kofleriaceae bacterium]
MKCVILAAGSSTRLRPHTDDVPKTLLTVAGVPILRRTITSFLRLGIREFVIGTGYLEHLVREAAASWFPDMVAHGEITFVSNAEYASTNNAYSLLLTRTHVDAQPFVLIDGDVVFDLAVVKQLVDHGTDCLAVRSVGGIGLEEVKCTADDTGRIGQIGKHVPVPSAIGESVGIELFSADSSRRLFAALHERIRTHGLVNEYYEAAFQQIIDDGVALAGIDIGSKYAAEIDTYDDLQEANLHLSAQPPFDTRVSTTRITA